MAPSADGWVGDVSVDVVECLHPRLDLLGGLSLGLEHRGIHGRRWLRSLEDHRGS